ncbi:MAG: UDP-glucose 4-epimerase GalE [Bacteroidales bacterium]|nr:UDP-glucose 4-epimerase GalE [Bacteroidales bacterium]MBN2820621.1 UDP-glucose 4-epimerase GalE [Bacteroidales bacterium]
MKQKVLVTGGAGYIGSHTCVELIEAGYEVIVADNLSNSSEDSLDGVEKITGVRPSFEKLDLCDKDKVFDLFRKYPGIEAIIHFAALKAVGESVQIPLAYYHNNLESLINLLLAMSEFGEPGLVFSSSCTVYGQPDVLPVTEKAPIKKAESPYGNTKQICEEIIQDALKANNKLSSIALRYFNPIGAHKSAHIGELPLGVPQNLVPFVTQTAAGIREQLSVFGNDYDTPDGSAIRDYINVTDLAKAHVKAVERLIEKKSKHSFEVFNLGTGTGLSVLEIVNAFEKATGVKLNYKIVGRREGDIVKVWAETTHANEVLGWKAEVPLEETLLSAWEWEKRIRNID